jgi:ubiquinone/menaquinone biosynthesis C-methylase UbiE
MSAKMDTKDFYEDVWRIDANEKYLKENMEIAPMRRAKRKLIELGIHKDNHKITELGCGIGFNLAHMKNKKNKVLEGIDISENAISLANTLYPGPNYSVADISTMTLNQPDTLLLVDVLEHMQDDSHILKECAKAKRVIIITDFSKKYDNQKYQTINVPNAGHGGDYRLYGYKLFDKMKKLGFHVEKIFLQGKLINWITQKKYEISRKKIEDARRGLIKPGLVDKFLGTLMYLLVFSESFFIRKGEIICLNCSK